MYDAFIRKGLIVSAGYFVYVAAVGLLMRLMMAGWVEINYYHWMQSHSHVAFMGFVFNVIYLLVVARLPIDSKRLESLFWVYQVVNVGTLLSFVWQGYAAVSIAFSTFHIVLSVVFVVRTYAQLRELNGGAWIRIGMIFMLVSSAGPFALGPLSALGYKGTIWYYLSIQFYLHFFYNGWFVFALIGLLADERYERPRKWLMVAMLPMYFGAVLLYDQSIWVYALSAVGALAFSVGLTFLFSEGFWKQLWSYGLFGSLVIGSLIAKALMILLINIPAVLDVVVGLRHVIVGFMHLTFLGIVVPMILIQYRNYMVISRFHQWIYAFGFVVTELSLFLSPVLPVDTVVGFLVTGAFGLVIFALFLVLRGANKKVPPI